MATDGVHVGPWGGNGGDNPWTFIPDGRITQIRISCGGCVYSIRFTYKDRDNIQHHSDTYGGDGGTPITIPFAEDEEINAISGTVGEFNSVTVITSLSFYTNKQTYGPYGTENGTSFTMPETTGKIIGFFGNYGDYLDSLGVILGPD